MSGHHNIHAHFYQTQQRYELKIYFPTSRKTQLHPSIVIKCTLPSRGDMLTQIAFGIHGNQTNKSTTSRTHQALSIVTLATGMWLNHSHNYTKGILWGRYCMKFSLPSGISVIPWDPNAPQIQIFTCSKLKGLSV